MTRYRMERVVLLPFSLGCVSESSVALGLHKPTPTRNRKQVKEEEDDEESLSSTADQSVKGSSYRFLHPLPKPNLSTGFNRVVKGFKNISQFFVYKEEMEEEEEEGEMEMEMEIGSPTDVKHVAHIGLDDDTTSSTADQEANHDHQPTIMGSDPLRTTQLMLSDHVPSSSVSNWRQQLIHHQDDHLPLPSRAASSLHVINQAFH